MPVVKRVVSGHQRWVVDRVFVGADGGEIRYRRVAKIQTQRGARAEEQQVLEHWHQHGSLPIRGGQSKKSTPPKRCRAKWEDAVDVFKKHHLPSRKPTTRRGYEKMLDGPWMQHWDGQLLTSITKRTIVEWDQQMDSGGLSSSTRRNHHILLRVILKSVGPDEDEPGLLLEQLPTFPKLPKVGRTAVEATSPDELRRLLTTEHEGLRLAIALAAFAGLRSGEVRALTKKDVDLTRNVITITKSTGADEVSTTKSGHARVVPITPDLRTLLEPHLETKEPSDLVTVNAAGNPWGDIGLSVAYRRLAKRHGVGSTRFHSLRHHFATQLFGAAGADAVTVQNLLGHRDLSTTQRYAHYQHERAVAAVRALSDP